MATEFARAKAAQIWTKPSTSHIEMNGDLCEAIAEEIDAITSKPWLGNATNRELLNELTTRIQVHFDLDYKTTGHD